MWLDNTWKLIQRATSQVTVMEEMGNAISMCSSIMAANPSNAEINSATAVLCRALSAYIRTRDPCTRTSLRWRIYWQSWGLRITLPPQETQFGLNSSRAQLKRIFLIEFKKIIRLCSDATKKIQEPSHPGTTVLRVHVTNNTCTTEDPNIEDNNEPIYEMCQEYAEDHIILSWHEGIGAQSQRLVKAFMEEEGYDIIPDAQPIEHDWVDFELSQTSKTLSE